MDESRALKGAVRPHQQLILSQLLADLAACGQAIEVLNGEIARRLQTEQARSKNTYLGAQYRRLCARRGSQRAALAVGHSILTIADHMMDRGTRFQDLGADDFDRRDPERVRNRLVHRLAKLGYKVTLEPST